jgi:hypothetical protein
MQLEIFRPKKFFELLYSSRFQPLHGTSLQLRYLYPKKRFSAGLRASWRLEALPNKAFSIFVQKQTQGKNTTKKDLPAFCTS